MAEMIPVDKLVNHVSNLETFGELHHVSGNEEEDQRFEESVKQQGVLHALIVVPDGDKYRVLSGHRRRLAAVRAGQKEVKCEIRHDLEGDELGQDVVWRDANEQRQMTREQSARFFRAHHKIEERLAKQRQSEAGGQKSASGNISRSASSRAKKANQAKSGATGRSRDASAKKTMGVSGKTAQKAAAVTEAIDAYREAGITKRADQLRDVLNERSTEQAYRLMNRLQWIDKIAEFNATAAHRIETGTIKLDDEALHSMVQLSKDDLGKAIRNVNQGRDWDHGLNGQPVESGNGQAGNGQPAAKRQPSASTTAKKSAKPATPAAIMKPLKTAIGAAGRELNKAEKATGGEGVHSRKVRKLLDQALAYVADTWQEDI